MRYARQLLAFALVFVLAASSGFAADEHVVSPQQIAATVGGQVARQDADRAAIREALARQEVRDTAKTLSIDMDRVTAAADTLSGVDLVTASDAARRVNQQLVGGDVANTTVIIVVLLVAVLLVVALR